MAASLTQEALIERCVELMTSGDPDVRTQGIEIARAAGVLRASALKGFNGLSTTERDLNVRCLVSAKGEVIFLSQNVYSSTVTRVESGPPRHVGTSYWVWPRDGRFIAFADLQTAVRVIRTGGVL